MGAGVGDAASILGLVETNSRLFMYHVKLIIKRAGHQQGDVGAGGENKTRRRGAALHDGVRHVRHPRPVRSDRHDCNIEELKSKTSLVPEISRVTRAALHHGVRHVRHSRSVRLIKLRSTEANANETDAMAVRVRTGALVTTDGRLHDDVRHIRHPWSVRSETC